MDETFLRFQIVKAVMQFGSEQDRKSPLTKANELFTWIKEECVQVEPRGRGWKKAEPTKTHKEP